MSYTAMKAGEAVIDRAFYAEMGPDVRDVMDRGPIRCNGYGPMGHWPRVR